MPAPVYPLTFPASPSVNVRVDRRRAQSRVESPFNYSQQVYKFPGKRWEIQIRVQKCTAAEAIVWGRFLDDLDGLAGTFNFNLTPHCPGVDPAPGTVLFRLAEPLVGWDSELACLFEFSFSAVEVI